MVNGVAITGNSFVMPAGNVSISVLFELIPPTVYIITYASSLGGTVTGSASSAIAGTTVNLTVIPSDGYRMVEGSLLVNGVAITGTSFVMPAGNVTVTVNFEPLPADEKAIIFGSFNNGTITGPTSAAAGMTVNLTVTPAEGYRLVEGSLMINGIAITGNSFEMPDVGVVITAMFELIPPPIYDITYTSLTNGSISGPNAVTAGTIINLIITPAEGYRLVAGSIRVNGMPITGTSFEMPEGGAVITAVFELIPQEPGTDPGDEPGTDPGDGPGTDPGDGPGTDPSDGPGTDPGDGPGTGGRPGSGTGTRPGNNVIIAIPLANDGSEDEEDEEDEDGTGGGADGTDAGTDGIGEGGIGSGAGNTGAGEEGAAGTTGTGTGDAATSRPALPEGFFEIEEGTVPLANGWFARWCYDDELWHIFDHNGDFVKKVGCLTEVVYPSTFNPWILILIIGLALSATAVFLIIWKKRKKNQRT